MISAIMALMALAIDLMLPAFDDMRDSFGLAENSNEIGQVITVFFLGLAVAQVVWGPLSDRFGRKAILHAGMVIYLIGAVGSALAPSLTWLLISRFVWGIGAAGARVVATAIVRDSFSGVRMAQAMSQIMAVFVLVPVLAPSVGTAIITVLPWRAIFWFCVLWTAGIALWSTRLPETLAVEHQRPLEWRAIGAGFRHVARTRVTAWYTVATMFLQAVFTAYLAASELIISDILGRGDQFPLVFGAVAVLFAIGALTNGHVVGRIGIERAIHLSLGALVVGSVGLVVLTMAADGRPSFWVFMPLLGLLLSMFMFLLPNYNTAALEPMGAMAGTASSFSSAVRLGGGAVIGGFIGGQISDSATPFAVGMLAMALLAVVATIVAER